MQYNGYQTLPVDSYDNWKAAVNGNGYDADASFGDQCWDLCAEFWHNLGYPNGYPVTAGTGAAYGCWDGRVLNAGNQFDLIYDKTQIKRGDVIVYDQFPANPYGHIGFADQDYQGSDNINILSQNNGGTPYAQGGSFTNVANYTLAYFRGAFRLKAWHQQPTPSTTSTHRFPWVLYARKLNNKRQGV